MRNLFLYFLGILFIFLYTQCNKQYAYRSKIRVDAKKEILQEKETKKVLAHHFKVPFQFFVINKESKPNDSVAISKKIDSPTDREQITSSIESTPYYAPKFNYWENIIDTNKIEPISTSPKKNLELRFFYLLLSIFCFLLSLTLIPTMEGVGLILLSAFLLTFVILVIGFFKKDSNTKKPKKKPKEKKENKILLLIFSSILVIVSIFVYAAFESELYILYFIFALGPSLVILSAAGIIYYQKDIRAILYFLYSILGLLNSFFFVIVGLYALISLADVIYLLIALAGILLAILSAIYVNKNVKP
ncbi:MAG: hypothetical protein KA981_11340 [Bacteroidia bacterium]|nr:hypothetical protein [Bacteroidia bacterium]